MERMYYKPARPASPLSSVSLASSPPGTAPHPIPSARVTRSGYFAGGFGLPNISFKLRIPFVLTFFKASTPLLPFCASFFFLASWAADPPPSGLSALSLSRVPLMADARPGRYVCESTCEVEVDVAAR